MGTTSFVSFAPGTFTEGAKIDDADLRVNQSRFVLWDYNGKIASPVIAWGLNFVDAEGKEHDQYYSLGDDAIKNFQIGPEGKTLIKKDAASKGLSGNSNGGQLAKGFIEAGFPEAKLALLGQDATIVEGYEAHWMQKAQPKRSGLKPRPGQREDRVDTILLPAKTLRLPWDGNPVIGVGGRNPISAPLPPTQMATGPLTPTPPGNGAATPDALRARAADLILSIILEKGGSIAKSGLAALVYGKVSPGDPARSALVGLAFDDGFLGSGTVPWKFAGGILSM